MIRFNLDNALPFLSEALLNTHQKNAETAMSVLHQQQDNPSAFLGWMQVDALHAPLNKIEEAATRLSEECEVVVIVGIGGSYLGAKAVIEALHSPFESHRPEIIFAGHHLDTRYHQNLLHYLEKKSFGIIVISKSGTTTEPAIAFRLLRLLLEQKIGVQASAKRIIAVTDKNSGVLKQFADSRHYTTFEIPDNIGGRFSVLSPVGLLPIAVAGYSARRLLEGAKAYADGDSSAHLQYAAVRHTLYQGGYAVELLSSFYPSLQYMTEWWKQLFGESEGKDRKGLFPASAIFTTDLHSLGQYIQEGTRLMFETVLSVEQSEETLVLPALESDDDQLNYLAGMPLAEINRSAEEGTRLAHVAGGMPLLSIGMNTLDEQALGALFYFFELSCAVSGTMLGVNPFNQPGVEAYKTNMFALLNKPGYEAQRTELLKKINR